MLLQWALKRMAHTRVSKNALNVTLFMYDIHFYCSKYEIFVYKLSKMKAFFFTVVSSDPALECLPFLESRLQETNNLSAFLANVRKEFISLARR